MHNVLFSIVCIKRVGGAKALYSPVRTYTYVYAPQDVSKDNDVDARQRQ